MTLQASALTVRPGDHVTATDPAGREFTGVALRDCGPGYHLVYDLAGDRTVEAVVTGRVKPVAWPFNISTFLSAAPAYKITGTGTAGEIMAAVVVSPGPVGAGWGWAGQTTAYAKAGGRDVAGVMKVTFQALGSKAWTRCDHYMANGKVVPKW